MKATMFNLSLVCSKIILIQEIYLLIFFSWDLKTPVLLDFEIWKASNMLFQHIPYGDKDTDIESDNETLWDDSWHEVFGGGCEAKKVQKSDSNQNNGECSSPQEKVPEVQITNDDVNTDRNPSVNGKQD